MIRKSFHFDLNMTVKKPNHYLQLNKGARSNLAWWNEVLVTWNGILFLVVIGEQEPSVILTSDASSSWHTGGRNGFSSQGVLQIVQRR